MTERKPYPSDSTDAQWALIEPVLTAWKAAHPSVSGHEGNYALREIVNAIRYQGRTGVQWDCLPMTCRPRARRTTTSPNGATTAPTRRSTTCCAGTCARRRAD
ncbi:transposase [Planomonospora sp. ID67723]|uniref:transposase n=1 Tax=Planomonospora sp. ID67723 TaxID=2738134 RepID=UPI0035A851D9